MTRWAAATAQAERHAVERLGGPLDAGRDVDRWPAGADPHTAVLAHLPVDQQSHAVAHPEHTVERDDQGVLRRPEQHDPGDDEARGDGEVGPPRPALAPAEDRSRGAPPMTASDAAVLRPWSQSPLPKKSSGTASASTPISTRYGGSAHARQPTADRPASSARARSSDSSPIAHPSPLGLSVALRAGEDLARR